MITAEFDYQAPKDLSSVLKLLKQNADHAKILGGGMTLLPMLNLGLISPELLISLRSVGELKGIRLDNETVMIGAATTHYTVSTNPLIHQYAPLIGLAAGLIGDAQVRNRGTIGGSLAHADPAANYLTAVIALDSTIELAGATGFRSVPAKDFFSDVMSTLLADDEIIVSVRIPQFSAATGYSFQKFTRVKGAFPIVCAAARIDGKEGWGRLVIGGVTGVPIAIKLQAGEADLKALGNTIRAGASNALEDQNGDSEYKQEMAVVYGLRAFEEAYARARRVVA